ELGAVYRNAMGVTKGPYSLSRARDYNAGRPIQKQHQTLIQCVVMEAFPGNDWVSDDRNYLARLMDRYGCYEALTHNCELDIGTKDIVDGGLWVEYQGHQNHDEGGSAVDRDKAKVQVCAGRCLLLVIPKIKHLDVCQAIQSVKHALENHPDRVRAEKALEQWKEPDPDHVRQRWLKAMPEMAKDSARRLRESMDQHGHVLLNDELEIFSKGTFSYQCGYCGEHSHDNNVKQYIDGPAKGCEACQSLRMLEHGERNRREKWSNHPLWPSLPDVTKAQLCDNSLKAACPKCGSEVGKENLFDRPDYFCLCCLDTGRIITGNGQSAGTVYQNLEAIKEVIHAVDENPHVRFEDQISVEDGNIVLTLTVNGMTRSLPL
ncbi:MAG: hypothetical protein MJA84_15605, partial [Firmicutes bacterium]|nr:hypothetical protein [Bacillota bacterium]